MSFPVFSKLGPSLRHREQQRAKELDACVTRTQSSPSVPLGLSRAREAQMERAGDATNGVAYERTAPLCHASMQDANEGSAEDRAVGRGTWLLIGYARVACCSISAVRVSQDANRQYQ